MEAQCCSNRTEDAVMQRLRNMRLVDRMRLLKKYSRIIEIRCRQNDVRNWESIVLKIHRLKFSGRDLVEAYMERDAVLDLDGCRLHEFLNAELGS